MRKEVLVIAFSTQRLREVKNQFEIGFGGRSIDQGYEDYREMVAGKDHFKEHITRSLLTQKLLKTLLCISFIHLMSVKSHGHYEFIF